MYSLPVNMSSSEHMGLFGTLTSPEPKNKEKLFWKKFLYFSGKKLLYFQKNVNPVSASKKISIKGTKFQNLYFEKLKMVVFYFFTLF